MRGLRRSGAPRFLSDLCPLVIVASVAACDVGAGFEDLGDSLLLPDAALLDRPGRRLAEGSYAGLTVDGSLEDGGRVLALRLDKEEPGLAIVPFLDGEPCELFPAFSFERVSSRVDIDLSALVAVQTSQSDTGLGTVRLVDFQCQDVIEPIEDARLPRVAFPEMSPRGLLLLTGSGALQLIDAEEKKLLPIAAEVQAAKVAGKMLWTLENGEVVGRDEDLGEVVRLGDEVTGFWPDLSDYDLVFSEGGALFGFTFPADPDSDEETLRQISEDGCEVQGISATVLAYFSPCADRRLVLEVSGESLGHDDIDKVHLRGPGGVLQQGPPDVDLGFDDDPSTFVLLQSDDPAATSGDLLVATLPPKPEVDDEGFVELSFQRIAQDISLSGGQLFQHLVNGVGDLVELEKDDGEITGVMTLRSGVTLLPGVEPFESPGVLSDFDGRTGTLTFLKRKKDDVTATELSEAVPLQSITREAETNLVAYVADFDGSYGTPYLFDGKEPLAVGKGALHGTLRFLDQPRALAYLSRGSTDARADLHAYLVESGINLLLAEGVNEYRGLPWPSPGILYSVWEGENSGLWLSKAR